MSSFQTVSPIDGSVVYEAALATDADVDAALATAHQAQRGWRATPLGERIGLLSKLVDEVLEARSTIEPELTAQMGRPSRYTGGELGGFEERARYMLDVAPASLEDIASSAKDGFRRFIRREPLGVVLVLAPWNYPWLTSVNAVIPALAAGNTVLLGHSKQTPLVAERFVEAGRRAGLPPGVFEYRHMTHASVGKAVADPRVDFVAFTGSVEGGRTVHRAGADRFIAMGLELGGKDPAYVCDDAELEATVAGLVDGAYFNSGQSCCGIERIYVHQARYDDFVEGFAALTREYVLDDPRKETTTLGPVVRVSSAEGIQAQMNAALSAGARGLLDSKSFGEHDLPYLAPQVLVDVTHDMAVMTEETFGPVVGIMKVQDDAEAIAHMNDSRYGLTASVWTADPERALRIGEQVDTGTWFMNRCDYLDPELAWTGVKDSGRGCTLSRVGYEHLTRPKSFHLRLKPAG
ncbi:MAG: aldehyde dehydrogenase family protein [Myxococcota bacterium]